MSTTTERRMLLLLIDTMPDPADIMTWSVDGRLVEPDEVRLLHGLTVEDAAAVVDLLRLQIELKRAVNSERWGGAS